MTLPAEIDHAEVSAAVWQQFLDDHFPSGIQFNYLDESGQLVFPPRLLSTVMVMAMRGEYPVLAGFDLKQEDYDIWIYVDSWKEIDRHGHYVVRCTQVDPNGGESRSVELSSWISEDLAARLAEVRPEDEQALAAISQAAAQNQRIELAGLSADEILASVVHVDGYIRTVNGKTVHVDGYTYDRASGRKIPDTILRSRGLEPGTPAADKAVADVGARDKQLAGEKARGETRSAQKPGLVSAYQRPDPATATGPMSEQAATQRMEMVHGAISDAQERGMSTDAMYTFTDSQGNLQWNAERAFQHAQIVESILARSEHVPQDRKGVIAGGLPGAGKTTTLQDAGIVDPRDYISINPDDIKEEMAARSMIPHVEGLTPMEASTLVHQEAGSIADALAHRAMSDGRNVMWDVTMSNGQATEWAMSEMRKNGYRKIDGLFVDVPAAVSEARVQARWQDGVERWLGGDQTSYGGRYVPPSVTRRAHGTGDVSTPRRTFESLKDGFSTWALYDNSSEGEQARLLEHSSRVPGTSPDEAV
jgi:predicted kinase